MSLFLLLCNICYTLRDWWEAIADWLGGIPVVGDALHDLFHGIANHFKNLGDIFFNIQDWWDWLVNIVTTIFDAAIKAINGWITNYIQPLSTVLTSADIGAWITDHFNLKDWITWLIAMMGWMSEWSAWVVDQIAKILDWTAIKAKIDEVFDLSGIIARLAEWFSWFQGWFDWANSSLSSVLQPGLVWGKFKTWLDESLDDEVEWIQNKAAQVLNKIW